MRIISELFHEILNQKLELALTSDKETLLKNLTLGEKITGTIVGKQGSLSLIKIKGQVFKAQTNIALKIGSQVSLKVIDNNYPVRLKLLDEVDSRDKLLTNIQKDYLGIKASELKTNYSIKEIYKFLNSLKTSTNNDNLVFKKLEIFRSILDYFNLEPKESNNFLINPKKVKEIFNLNLNNLHDLFEKLTFDIIIKKADTNLEKIDNKNMFLDKNITSKSKTNLIDTNNIKFKNNTYNSKKLNINIYQCINNQGNYKSLNKQSINNLIYTNKTYTFNIKTAKIYIRHNKTISNEKSLNIDTITTNYKNDTTKNKLISDKISINNNEILNISGSKQINSDINNLDKLGTFIKNRTIESESKLTKTILDIPLKDEKDIIKETPQKENKITNENINKRNHTSKHTEVLNPKKNFLQKEEGALKKSTNPSDQAKKIFHPHENKANFIDQDQLIDKKLDVTPIVSQEVVQNLETISNHFKLLGNLILQLNQTGIPFLLIPLWFNKSEGFGHLAYWKDNEEDNVSEAQRTQHLFFDLDLHKLGTIKIHVLIKGQKGLELFMWAKDSTLKLFRKESIILKESLSSQGFNILGFEIWDIKHLEQKWLPISEEMPEITSSFHKIT